MMPGMWCSKPWPNVFRPPRGCDTVARLGGDEFLVALTALHAPENAGVVARKVPQAVDADIDLPGGHCCRVGASIGISVYPEDGEDMDALMLAADAAMYRSKQKREESLHLRCCR